MVETYDVFTLKQKHARDLTICETDQTFCLCSDTSGKKSFQSRFWRLHKAYKDPLTEIQFLFRFSAFTLFTTSNRFLQRSDPLVHKVYFAIQDSIKKNFCEIPYPWNGNETPDMVFRWTLSRIPNIFCHLIKFLLLSQQKSCWTKDWKIATLTSNIPWSV